jgi:hypothetical protein
MKAGGQTVEEPASGKEKTLMGTQLKTSPYRNFEHIDHVVELGPDDQLCIDEVRSVLERHGRLERIGVCLLHRHFDLADDEILLESCDEMNRTLQLRPVRRSELEGQEITYTTWSLEQGSALQACSKKDHRPPAPAVPSQACTKKDH